MFLEQAFRQTITSEASLNVLDLCAAPGGKSTHLLSLMNSNSLLVSNEVIQSRAGILSENIQKWGHSNVVVANNDPKDFQRLEGFFDVIVVDAPCSGEGLFRKDPAAVREWSEDAVLRCSKRQRRILSDVWPALKKGGVLIYSTCTYNGLENEENLKWLRQEYKAESIPLKVNEGWNVQKVEENGITGYRFFPHRVRGEGFFLGTFRKVDDQSTSRLSPKSNFVPPSKKIKEQLSAWISNAEEKTFINRNDRFQFFPKSKAAEIEFIAKNMRVVAAGTLTATAKHDRLIPEPALALSIEINREQFNVLDLDHESALQFLRRDSLTVPPGNQKGFSLVAFQDLPLGWVNVLDNRVNNLYPQEWRIRMR
jgi:NOL1/NOP2/fmu family ribosome biogenesis protein